MTHDATTADGADREPPPVERAWLRHVSSDTSLLDRLIVRHRERQRRYHRIEHVVGVLDRVAELAATEPVADLDAVMAAALYHDAVYEPQHPANERASARLARRDLAALGWDEQRCDTVGRMIEGTATHLDPPDTDTAVLFDADLCILGAEPDEYAVYVGKIRAEYGHLDDGEWRTGRARVLQAFLDRDPIFATATGRDRFEAQARRNVAGELGGLTTPASISS